MIVITGVINQVKTLFDEIPKRNPYPFHFYFPFALSKDNIEVAQVNNKTRTASYKVEANNKLSSTHWMWHATCVIILWIFSFYQAIFEDVVFVGFATHLTLVVVATSSLVFTYIHHFHLSSFLKYFNELLLFEARHIDYTCGREQKYWKENVNVSWPLLSIQIQRKVFPVFGFCIVVSLTIFPYSFWRLVPSGILNQFAISNFGGTNGFILEHVCRTLTNFTWTYICCYVNLNGS